MIGDEAIEPLLLLQKIFRRYRQRWAHHKALGLSRAWSASAAALYFAISRTTVRRTDFSLRAE
jgi:hypothetical protein